MRAVPEAGMDVAGWLRSLGLEQYAPAFRDHAIEHDVLPDLTDEHLKELGLPLGHRLKLLKAIAALRPDAAASAPAAPPTEGERRQVTVLFADLAGYTALTHELGAEEVHALTDRFFGLAHDLIERFGGTVDKHIGDCVMAIFGAPVAHDNDPERAVRAALALRDAVPDLGRALERPLDVHIGIASGQVVASGGAGHRTYSVTGDSVNLASRLTDSAEAGTILISDAVRRLLDDRLQCTDVGTVTVKGLRDPVRAFKLIGLGEGQARLERPFVGRRAEVRQFADVLRACKENGAGQAIHVRGEAGIGKSRLVEEFQRAARDAGFACHGALVLDFGTGAGDAIRALAAGLLGRDAEARGAAAAASLGEHLVAADDAVFLHDLLGLPQPEALRAVYDAMDNPARDRGRRRALVRLVERASRQRPRLLTVEDVHWADRPTLEHLAKLVAAAVKCPVLLVMTSRLDGDPFDQAWQSRTGGAPMMVVNLGPLRREEALALAGAFFDAADRLAARCVERAAGNPLFLEQLLRHVEETDEAGVPGSVQSLVQARMDRLDASDRQALQAAAVLGQRFDARSLAHVLDRPGYALDRLIAHLLIRPQGDAFLFAHALIRDAVYDTLLRSRRRELHRRAAAWFAGRDLVLHAEHLARAEEPEAPRAYLEAARSQAAAYRHEPALRLVERGLALAVRQADRFDLACFRGELLHDLGAMQEAGEAYGDAFAAAEGCAERCRAWIGLAAVKRVTDDLEGALADLDRAEAEAVGQGLTDEQARIHFLRGNLLFPRGDIEGCLREHGRSLELARQCGSAELEAAAQGGLGDAEYMRGRLISAHAHFRGCIELARRHGFGRIEVANWPMAAIARWYAGDAAGAVEDAEAAIAAAARLGHRRAEMVAHHAAYFSRHMMNDGTGASPHVERALALARQLGARRFEAEALIFRAELHRMAGRRSEALADVGEALSIGRQTGMAFIGPMILAVQALATDDPRVRDEALAEGEALLAAGSASHNHLQFRRDAIEVCLKAGEWDRAERFAAALEDYARAEPMPWTDHVVARGRALAAFGRGRRDDDLRSELERLREQGERLGLMITLPAIKAALASFDRA
jgi:class 3 adenylate cyclase/tetratricopeptide (TPR) repeat protein